MSISPTSKQKWLSLILIPFKTYGVIFPILCFIYHSESFYVREAQMRSMNGFLDGYLICFPILILAALIQALTHQRQAATVSLVFALAIFVSLAFLLPMIVLTR